MASTGRVARTERKNMDLSLLLIIIGIVLAVLVHWGLGIALILIGLALLIVPRLRSGPRTV
jgi:hypothetical protein